MVRQFIRSAIRDCAVCRIGALCPSSRPATTTAITPEAWIFSAAMYAANGTTSEIAGVHQRVGDVLAELGDQEERREADQQPAAGGADEVERRPRGRSTPHRGRAPAAIAVRSATSAVASLSSDSPSRIVTIRRGSPIRRPIAVAATASGGATTAPIANAAGQPTSGSSACTSDARRRRSVNTTRPDREQQDRPPVGVEVDQRGLQIAAAYSSGGSRPSSTTSGSRCIFGTPGRYDAATQPDQEQRAAGSPAGARSR